MITAPTGCPWTDLCPGVDFAGKIALVKYGGVFRGLKIKGTRAFMVVDCDPAANLRAAQEAGAVGCLIFTDPGDDFEITEENGYAQYPDGPARQASGVEDVVVDTMLTMSVQQCPARQCAIRESKFAARDGLYPVLNSLTVGSCQRTPVTRARRANPLTRTPRESREAISHLSRREPPRWLSASWFGELNGQTSHLLRGCYPHSKGAQGPRLASWRDQRGLGGWTRVLRGRVLHRSERARAPLCQRGQHPRHAHME